MLNPTHAVWHKGWWLSAPTDYWVGLLVASAMIAIINARLGKRLKR